MNTQFHHNKAQKIFNAMRHFTVSEYEAIIEGCMLAGTHWFNAALHDFGLREDNEDILHAEYLHNGDRTGINLVAPEMLEALDEIETFRALYVRGNVNDGPQAATKALKNLEVIKRSAESAIPIR